MSKVAHGWKYNQGTKGTKVKFLFQGFHVTRVIFAVVYNLKFYILDI
jgi:hypothetical protein